jgi:hypothetical protein
VVDIPKAVAVGYAASNSNDQEEEAVWALLDELFPTR